MTKHAPAASAELLAETGPGCVRRVVTGHDALGRSIVLSDGTAPNVFRSERIDGLGSAVLWTTPAVGAHNEGNADAAPADVTIAMSPAPGTSIFRVADFPPDSHYSAEADPESMFTDIGGPQTRVVDEGQARHFWSHRTDSLDYAVVLEGEIWMIMDDGECLLRAGDVIVQRATTHAWSNRTDRRCRIAFVLLGTPPLSAPVGSQDRPAASPLR